MDDYEKVCERIALAISRQEGYAFDGKPADHALSFVRLLLHQLELERRKHADVR